MNTQRLVVLSLLAVAAGLSACSLIASHVPTNVGDAVSTGSKVASTASAAKDCEKFRHQDAPWEEEYNIGGGIAETWISKQGGLLIDAGAPGAPQNKLERYVNTVGKNLASQSARPTIPWTFGVLDSEVFNAYSAPGGYVFVTKGLLKSIDNEAQLAGVLAHEIAHVTERHAIHIYGSSKANVCEAALGAGAVAGDVLGNAFQGALGGSPLDLDHLGTKVFEKLLDPVVKEITEKGLGHKSEYQADLIAANLILNAGYDPNQYIAFLAKIPANGSAFANHPSSADRQKALNEWKAKVKSDPNHFPPLDPDSPDLKQVPLKDELAYVHR